jgi:hypothetical protein
MSAARKPTPRVIEQPEMASNELKIQSAMMPKLALPMTAFKKVNHPRHVRITATISASFKQCRRLRTLLLRAWYSHL